MYYVSDEFNSAARSNARQILVKALFNGATELTGDNLIDMTVTEATSASDGLVMGSTISSKLVLNLKMPEDALSLEGGWVEPWVGFYGVGALCPLGKYYITKATSTDDFVTATIEAYDGFSKTEEEYTPAIELPAPPETVVRDICAQKGIVLENGIGLVTGDAAVRLDDVSPIPHEPSVNVGGAAAEMYGKNLFNIDTDAADLGGLSTLVEKADGQIVAKQDAAGTFHFLCIPIPACEKLVGKTVTVSGKVKTSGINKGCLRVQWLNVNDAASGSFIASDQVAAEDFAEISVTGAIPEQPSSTYDTLALLLYTNTTATLEEAEYTATYKDVQIELGEQATELEAYKAPVEYVAGETALTTPTATIIVGGDTTIEATYNKDILGISPDVSIGYYDYTIRQYLGYIAGLAGRNARFSRVGELAFKWYSVTDHEIPGTLQYIGGFKKLTESNVAVGSITSGTSDNTLVAGIGAGFSFENPFMTQGILNNIFAGVEGIRYTPAQIKWRGNPSLEAGDVILAEYKNGAFHTVYIMEQTLRVSGGLYSEIKCFGKSDAAIKFDSSPQSKKLQQVYTTLQSAISDATTLLKGANGGVFEVFDGNADGINDGWVVHSLDELQHIKATVDGIGITTDGGESYQQAMTPRGINASAITTGQMSAARVVVGDSPLGDVFSVELDEDGHPVVTIGASDSDVKQKQTNDAITFVNAEDELVSRFSVTGAEWADMQQIKYCGFVWTKSLVTGNVRFTKVGEE